MGSTTSDLFNVSNSVRQGGILSPYLFTVYVDDLSKMLNSAGIGCHIHNCCTSHMSTDCVTASSVNMFKNKVDTYLRRAGYK